MNLFQTPILQKEGIYRALETLPILPLAQRSNFWPLTVHLYEPLWRKRSLSLLTRGQFSARDELQLMLEWLEPKPNQTVLDAACSAGLYARTLLKHQTLDVHAVDFSLPFLQKAKVYAAKEKLSITLVHADVTKLPYINEAFDHIVCGGSPNEFLDLEKTLATFSSAQTPG